MKLFIFFIFILFYFIFQSKFNLKKKNFFPLQKGFTPNDENNLFSSYNSYKKICFIFWRISWYNLEYARLCWCFFSICSNLQITIISKINSNLGRTLRILKKKWKSNSDSSQVNPNYIQLRCFELKIFKVFELFLKDISRKESKFSDTCFFSEMKQNQNLKEKEK